jgi:hypothetical protein
MEELKQFLSNNDILSLKFTGEDKLLHERFLRRLENRHYVHKAQDFTDLNDLIKIQEELRSVEYIGEVVGIDVTPYPDLTSNVKLAEKIEEFLKK